MVFFFTALLAAAADQLSKLYIRSILAIGQSLPETGLFRLTHITNTGSAFGLFQNQSFFLTIIAFSGIFLILLFVFLFSRHFPFLESAPGRFALGLILGGTTGNLTDRLRLGYVTDFIDVGIWPAFNLADSAVVIGCILFGYFLLFSNKSPKAKDLSQPEVPQ